MLYAFTSGAGNNGSAFAGITVNTPWYDTTIGLTMLAGRFLMIIPMLAIAGNLARQKVCSAVAGYFPGNDTIVHCALDRCDRNCRRTDFLPGIEPGPHP